MSLVLISKRLMSVFINASRRCRKLIENYLSLSEFKKRRIAMRCKETLTVLQFLVTISRIQHLCIAVHN